MGFTQIVRIKWKMSDEMDIELYMDKGLANFRSPFLDGALYCKG